MIGFFKITDKRDGQTYCIAESLAVLGVDGRFYYPPLYRDGIGTMNNGDVIFGVMDDSSGYGAILYKKDDGIVNSDGMTMNHNLTVKGNTSVKGSETVTGKVTADAGFSTDATIKGNSPNTTITLTAAHCAAIVGGATSGVPTVALTLVPVILSDV